MKNRNKKLFIYEFKEITKIPLITAGILIGFLLVNMGMELVSKLVKNDRFYNGAYELIANFSVYAFFAITVIYYVYRTFSAHKLYEKMRVNPERLFLIRIFSMFILLFGFVTILVLLGTVDMWIIRLKNEVGYQKEIKTALFALQGKNLWYLLFGVSVGMTGVMMYSMVVFIKNIIFSNERGYLKLLWIALFFTTVFASHYTMSLTCELPSIVGNQYFSAPIPYGKISYELYETYNMELSNAYSNLLKFNLCWNITNYVGLLFGFSIIILSFTSIGILNRRVNEDYNYKNISIKK